VSYYYFGYVINAMTGKMAALQTSVTFNLALASTAALAATAAFGLGYELASLVRRMSFKAAMSVGAGAVLLLAVVGNLEGVIEFGIANDIVRPSINDTVQVNDLETAKVSNDCLVPFPAAARSPTRATNRASGGGGAPPESRPMATRSPSSRSSASSSATSTPTSWRSRSCSPPSALA
jgi:hypothetical protein